MNPLQPLEFVQVSFEIFWIDDTEDGVLSVSEGSCRRAEPFAASEIEVLERRGREGENFEEVQGRTVEFVKG
jgi:hypothetical protein